MDITHDDIDTAASWADFDTEEDVRTDYSGRGMYGKTCIGYTGENPAAFIAALVTAVMTREQNDTIDAVELIEALGQIGRPGVDSMGLSTITYWPSLHLDPLQSEDD
ncbi:hypothetical protein SEA_LITTLEMUNCHKIN_75 [Gordonia phage LittleMunchkin]|nr:hypothetical protein SEA_LITTLEMUNCHKIN_75 [Gordonia phage LittleMunchkin]